MYIQEWVYDKAEGAKTVAFEALQYLYHYFIVVIVVFVVIVLMECHAFLVST